jgi:hypothetical protein
MTHTQLVGLPWTSDQPFAEASTCTTHNIHKGQTAINPAGFETAILANERPQTYALDCAATEIG